jgi:acyl-CoA dehydrogenase
VIDDRVFSDRARSLLSEVRDFVRDEVLPAEPVFEEQLAAAGDPHHHPAVMEELKATAKRAGLWNLFLPDEEHGAGLSTLEYAPMAEEMGRSPIGPEACNCNAPNTGNMEVLARYGTPEQQRQWLEPCSPARSARASP